MRNAGPDHNFRHKKFRTKEPVLSQEKETQSWSNKMVPECRIKYLKVKIFSGGSKAGKDGDEFDSMLTEGDSTKFAEGC